MGNDPNEFGKARTEQQNSAGYYLAVKTNGICLCAYTEAGSPQVALRVTDVAHRRELGAPKGVRKVNCTSL